MTALSCLTSELPFLILYIHLCSHLPEDVSFGQPAAAAAADDDDDDDEEEEEEVKEAADE